MAAIGIWLVEAKMLHIYRSGLSPDAPHVESLAWADSRGHGCFLTTPS